MKRFNLILILFIFSASLHATTVNVRLFTTKVVKSFIFSPVAGTYDVYGDGVLLTNSDLPGIFQMSLEGEFIILKTFEKTIGKYSTVKMVSKQLNGVFKIKSVTPETKVRTYEDDLSISIGSDKKQLLLINRVDLEKYIGGVVESESGTRTSLEYYKLQSILCRTYFLAHSDRHVTEGFQLCDDVHCQAYLSRTVDKDIKQGVEATKGLVIVDSDLNLITAAFHSNCGGQTVASQDVWAMPTSFLKSIKDTFCLSEAHAHWKRSIPLEDWKAYLQMKHNYPTEDSIKLYDANTFKQSNGREIYFTDKGLRIPLKTIRSDFQLKSTYFSIEQKGDNIIFNGRGYGHGVGLCQEGAMRMANLKYSYKDILNFYYKDIHLVDLAALNYFKLE